MGASSGIGLKMAYMLASRGVKVGLAARHTAPMEKLKEEYPDFVEYSQIDINSQDAPKKLYSLIERLGGMNIYFHVAGIGYENLNLNPQREVDIINTNACGFARMICAAYKYFRAHEMKGHIAAITSVAGTKGMGRLSAYSSSKRFAQTYLTALEQLSHAEKAGITFTDIRPGWIRTPLLLPYAQYPMEMSLEYATPLILKAIVKKRRVAYIDCRWGLLANIWKLLPDCAWIQMHPKLSNPDVPLPKIGLDETVKNI